MKIKELSELAQRLHPDATIVVENDAALGGHYEASG